MRDLEHILDNPELCFRSYRMSPFAFRQLLSEIEPHIRERMVRRARRPADLQPEEMLAIFLDWVGQGSSERVQARTFQRSVSSIHRARWLVLHAIVRHVCPTYVKQPKSIPTLRDSDPKYRFFSGAIGALDGTHVACQLPNEVKPRFRNRKGFTSQNVLIACDFKLNVTYCLPGGEGCAHDSQIYERANDLKAPGLGYYLGTTALHPYCHSSPSVGLPLLLVRRLRVLPVLQGTDALSRRPLPPSGMGSAGRNSPSECPRALQSTACSATVWLW
jgi:hypothetical protein